MIIIIFLISACSSALNHNSTGLYISGKPYTVKHIETANNFVNSIHCTAVFPPAYTGS